MMVGDGINDAPSLTTATIGVSLSSGTDIATSSADIVLTNNNLMKIKDIINISNKTIKNIKENLFWAFKKKAMEEEKKKKSDKLKE